ncbi:MAG: hypothetical protein DI535_24055 [Citrobacter freundii]|nr:MAG: hypothetical protein DI535_24055 [Citrobacter freundii]
MYFYIEPSAVRGLRSAVVLLPPFFRTFAAMKKWIATYIFFVGFILFSLSGTASCIPKKISVKKKITSFSRTARLSYFKTSKAHPFSTSTDQVGSSVNDFHHTGWSQPFSLLPGEYILASSFSHAANAITVRTAIVPDGYLLHLFPSHYFW